MKYTRRELLSIPNCLSYLRILLIPIFCLQYLQAKTLQEYYIAGGIILISSITDSLDGMIARKFNMITEFGKVIDPVADKLTHIAIAGCLFTSFPIVGVLFLAIVSRDLYMLIMGAIHQKHGQQLKGAMWYGKCCTASLFVVFLVLLFFPFTTPIVVNLLVGIELIVIGLTFILYSKEFARMKRKWI